MARRKKSLFSTTESELKKHIEANKSKAVDITSGEDVVADELAQLKAIEDAQNKQSSLPSSFDLPDPEELDKLMQSFEEENEKKEESDFEHKLEKEETKESENSLEETLEKHNEKAEEAEKNIRLKTNVATIKHHYVKKSIKEASDEANKRQKESEKFKTEVNKLMTTFGYSFMDAKKIYETEKEESKKQASSQPTNRNIIVTPVNQKKK